MKKKLINVLKISMILMILFGISSVSYAKEYTLDESTSDLGTKENPLIISIGDYETIVNYSNFKLPFYYKMSSDGANWIGLYKVALDQEKKRVIFTLDSARSSTGSEGDCYYASPGDRKTGINYLQSGAILDDNAIVNGQLHIYPVYTIKEIQNYGKSFGKDKTKTVILGNAYDDIALGVNTKKYVFVSENHTVTELMRMSSKQNSRSVNPSLDNGYWITYGNETPTITYAFYGVSSEVLDDNEANAIEKLITKVGISLGDAFLGFMRKLKGGWLSIDVLIFNQYKPTIIDFFGTSSSSGMYTSTMQNIINFWFKTFSRFAQVILIITLPVLGIRAMLFAGTPEQKSLTGLLSGWVVAVAFMFFGPYIMKYTIQINDALVATIRKQSKYSMASVYNLDFLDKYQEGEDSETSMLDKLNKVRDTVAAEAQEEYNNLQEELSKYETALQTAQNNFINSIAGEKLFQKYKDAMEERIASGGPYRRLSDDEIWEMVRNGGILKIGRKGTTLKLPISGNSDIAMQQVENYINSNGCSPSDIQIYYNSEMLSGGKTSSSDMFFTMGSVPDLIATDITNAAVSHLEAKERYDQANEKLTELEKAIEIEQKGLDLMGIMRERAGQTFRFVYLLIWFLLIYQMVLMLFLYYKRLITIAALITIYPLTIMMYGVEKAMGIDKPKALKTWMTEYIVNVFIQTAHALLYVTLVEGGLSIYENDPDNWLLFVFAVMALSPLESIVKAIIGFKAASTIATLKSTSQDVTAKAKAANDTRKIGESTKDIDKKAENKEKRIEKKQKRQDRNAQRRLNNGIVAGRKGAQNRYNLRDRRLNGWVDEKGKHHAGIRERNRKIRKLKTYAKKGAMMFRNAAAVTGVISSGIAGGGTAGDFQNGVTLATTIAGTKKASSANASGSTSATKKQPKSGGNTSSNMAAQNARNAASAAEQGNGGTTALSSTPPAQTPSPATQADSTQSRGSVTPEKIAGHEKLAGAFSDGLSQRRASNTANVNTANVDTNDSYTYKINNPNE